MTEEQLKQLTDFAAAKKNEDLLKVREEIEDLNRYQFPGFGVDTYLNAHEVYKIIDKHLSKPL